MKRFLTVVVIAALLFVTSCSRGARCRKDTLKAMTDIFGVTEVTEEEFRDSGVDIAVFGREMDGQYLTFDFTDREDSEAEANTRGGRKDLDTLTFYSVYFTDARQYEEGTYGHLGIVVEDYGTEQGAANAFLKFDPALGNGGIVEASDGRIIYEDENDKYRVQAIRDNDLSLTTCTIYHLEGDTLLQITFTYSIDLDSESGSRVIALLDELGIDHPAFADIVH